MVVVSTYEVGASQLNTFEGSDVPEVPPEDELPPPPPQPEKAASEAMSARNIILLIPIDKRHPPFVRG